MKSLLVNAMVEYDLVILNTSSISRYVDTMTLSEQTDGVILVVRPEYTPKAVAVQTIADLQRSGSVILGMVINATPDPTKVGRSNQVKQLDSGPRRFLNRKFLRSSV